MILIACKWIYFLDLLLVIYLTREFHFHFEVYLPGYLEKGKSNLKCTYLDAFGEKG